MSFEPNFRALAAATEDGSGGWLISGGSSGADYLQSTEVYKNGVWTSGPPLPSPLYNHCQVEVNGKVYITGGRIDANSTKQTLLMDGHSWKPVANMSEGRNYHACVESNGKVFVIGGSEQPSGDKLASVEVYDPTDDSWSKGPELPIALKEPQAFTYGNNIYVLAGEDPSKSKNQKIFSLSGTDYSDWIPLPATIEWNSARVFVSPPVFPSELLQCDVNR